MTDDMFLYTEDPKESEKKIVEPINEGSIPH